MAVVTADAASTAVPAMSVVVGWTMACKPVPVGIVGAGRAVATGAATLNGGVGAGGGTATETEEGESAPTRGYLRGRGVKVMAGRCTGKLLVEAVVNSVQAVANDA